MRLFVLTATQTPHLMVPPYRTIVERIKETCGREARPLAAGIQATEPFHVCFTGTYEDSANIVEKLRQVDGIIATCS